MTEKSRLKKAIFIVGPHGVGKSYLADKICEKYPAFVKLDCGPTVRMLHDESGFNGSLHEWIEFNKQRGDKLFIETQVLLKFQKLLYSRPDSEVLLVVGNRSLAHINYLAEGLHLARFVIVYLDCQNGLNKSNYEIREKIKLTNSQFWEILVRDQRRGLEELRLYVIDHLEYCYMIINNANNTVNLMNHMQEVISALDADIPVR